METKPINKLPAEQKWNVMSLNKRSIFINSISPKMENVIIDLLLEVNLKTYTQHLNLN